MSSLECDDGKCVVKHHITEPSAVLGHIGDDQLKDDMAFSVSVIVVVMLAFLFIYWIIKSRIRLLRAFRVIWGVDGGQPLNQPPQQPQQSQQPQPLEQQPQQHHPQQQQPQRQQHCAVSK